MAKLQCEICGGKLVGKPGGVFECENCGMEFSKEWAQEKIQEIKGTVKIEGPVEVTGSVKVEGGVNKESLLKRGMQALEDKDWTKAWKCFEQVLDIDPECAEGYLGKAQAEWRIVDLAADFAWLDREGDSRTFQRAMQFAGDAMKDRIDAARQTALERRTEALQARAEEARRKEEETLRAQAEETRRKEEAARRKAEQEAADEAAREASRQEFIKRFPALRERVEKGKRLIAADYASAIALTLEGTVKGCPGSHPVIDWNGVEALAMNYGYALGLREDGTVLTAKTAGFHDFGQCDVERWPRVIAISAGQYNAVGLTDDGRVIATAYKGHRNFDYGQTEVSSWRMVTAVAAGDTLTLGLMSDGTVLYAGNWEEAKPFAAWRDIVAVCAGGTLGMGLHADGTVEVAGSDSHEICNKTCGWREIVDIAAGRGVAVGLKADGTVVCAAGRLSREHDLSGWRDIAAVTVGGDVIMGLKTDGTVVFDGSERDRKQLEEASYWKLFNSIDTIDQERAEVREQARQRAEEKRRAQEERDRQKQRELLEMKQRALQRELAKLHGLFTGKRKKEIEAQMAEIDAELSKL